MPPSSFETRGFSPLPASREREAGSHPLHKTIHHPLLPRLVEADGQLVAVDGGDVAVAELEVEDAVADRIGRGGAGRFGDQLAFDGQGLATASRSLSPVG